MGSTPRSAGWGGDPSPFPSSPRSHNLGAVGTALRILVIATDEAAVAARCAEVERARGALAGATHLGSAPHDDLGLDGVDVAVVDLLGPPGGFDRVHGLAVVRAVAPHVPRVLACAPAVAGPVVALRAVRAGADCLVTPAELATRLAPAGAARRVEGAATGLDAAALARLGLSRSSDPDAGLDLIAEQGLEGAFTGEDTLSRRRTITVRTALAQRIGVVPLAAGSGAVVDRRLPSWAQLREVVDLARGAHLG